MAQIRELIGVIGLGLIGALPIWAIDLYTDSNYLIYYSKELSVGVLLAVLALNIAVITFLLSNLILLEQRLNQNFNSTRKELRHNVYFMICLVALNLLLVAGSSAHHFNWGTLTGGSIIGYLSTAITFLVIYAMKEVVDLALDFKGAQNQP